MIPHVSCLIKVSIQNRRHGFWGIRWKKESVKICEISISRVPIENRKSKIINAYVQIIPDKNAETKNNQTNFVGAYPVWSPNNLIINNLIISNFNS
jgi:hypothetical protein